ncbi:helix-turn-helix domain-containing protein [Cohnella terricola]|uniref:Helix-turn-helix transcriptional regulator n=1 Tax=Cohnella terricola TaxID=1289167 RepID=A0A559JQK1_9BACL|nr:helix-turn-helix transcriptional regulator [Cohnella terricola]TVY02161.1 helix-turn-helix transcriptional regulator [Cohnella terricola]
MDKNVLRAVGQRLRDIRKQTGLSQEELGEKAGFHFSYIGGVERGEKNISLLNLQKIADALEVHIYDFFQYTSYKKSGNSEKSVLIDELTNKLISLKTSDLKKVNLLLDELFN